MFTLSDCIIRINQTLNYPSLTYTDISHFFDQAISELNSTFRIGMPLVSQMIRDQKLNIRELPNLTLISSEPTGSLTDIPAATPDGFADTSKVYYNTDDDKLYKYNTSSKQWVGYDKMYGIYADSSHMRTYETTSLISMHGAIWTVFDEKRLNDFDLNIYLPTDWIILFVIPYVCFKAATRDGGSGLLYNEEYVQGFQQIQTSYDVPNFVELRKVAHLPAYTAAVKVHMDTLDTVIPTRAVYEDMKIGNAILPQYHDFNSRGGWGF